MWPDCSSLSVGKQVGGAQRCTKTDVQHNGYLKSSKELCTFRRSASLAIPHRTSFAARYCQRFPECTLNTQIATFFSMTYELQRETALIRTTFRHFQDQFLTTNRKKWGEKQAFVSQALGFWRFAARSHRTVPNISESQPHRAIHGY